MTSTYRDGVGGSQRTPKNPSRRRRRKGRGGPDQAQCRRKREGGPEGRKEKKRKGR